MTNGEENTIDTIHGESAWYSMGQHQVNCAKLAIMYMQRFWKERKMSPNKSKDATISNGREYVGDVTRKILCMMTLLMKKPCNDAWIGLPYRMLRKDTMVRKDVMVHALTYLTNQTKWLVSHPLWSIVITGFTLVHNSSDKTKQNMISGCASDQAWSYHIWYRNYIEYLSGVLETRARE